MFKSTDFIPAQQISLSKELVVLGIQQTPLTSLLLSKGNTEKAMATVHSWQEKTFDTTADIAFAEGSETTVFQKSVRRQLSNILQIFKKAASVSGTAIAMNGGQFTEEIADRLLELKVNLERTLINGEKDDASTTGIRKMSGLVEFAPEANLLEGANASLDLLKIGMKKLWDANIEGGEFYYLVNADMKNLLDNEFKNNYTYQHRTTNFGLVVESINTNFGTVNVVLSKHVPAKSGVLFNSNYVDLVTLREASFEPLSKDGDYIRGQVVGEYTLKVGTDKAVAVIKDTAAI